MLRRTPWWAMLPSQSYNNFINIGTLQPDPRQQAAVTLADKVYQDMIAYTQSSSAKIQRNVELRPPNRLGLTPSNVIRKQQEHKLRKAAGLQDEFHPLSHVKGLYLYGGVGCGKTMIMDILFNECPLQKKMRVHFHQFMLDVHKTMHQIRSQNRTKDAEVDIFEELAQRLVTNAELLCFDEMVVSDVSDAMILKRLFSAFYRIGVCAVFTSNRHPNELYKGGLNRESFLPFIRLLEEQCFVHDMQSTTDYRLTTSDAKTYLAPFSDENETKFNQMFLEVTKAMPPKETVLRVFGRDVLAPRTVGGVCRFDFGELCRSEMSTADYEILAKSFHTWFLENVPQLPHNDTDIKRRFITLIDILYEYKCKVIMYAEVEPQLIEAPAAPAGLLDAGASSKEKSLFEMEIGRLIDEGEGSFQMQRCTSRMMEMRSTEYLRSEHKGVEVDLSTE
ncbi:ATPase, putative [Bodo saltans]|uniref:ATPase, putative n=1 Tax=Bodo saltans TaxID=75058 RepID=A0A0S4J9H9_BODSA|nr:ATPase, putative [Bodo saltans]|eukprot:CUG86904.1 ATPase, putative [Bodo saltans]